MDLTKPIRYSTGSGKWSLVGPVRCDLDNQFIELSTQLVSMNDVQRNEFAARGMYGNNGWTLLEFGMRMSVFALRESDSQLLITGANVFRFGLNHNDPRDVYNSSGKLIFVAIRLGLSPEELFEESGMMETAWFRKWFEARTIRNKIEENRWGFREVESELGTGLIDSSGPFNPQSDILALAMRIARVIESDAGYLSTYLELDQTNVVIRANPDPTAHPEMKQQLLRMCLGERETVQQAEQFAANHRIPSNEAGFVLVHERYVFDVWARSWVSGVANVETNESVDRFREPIAALIQNFHRYRWRTWQAYEYDGCITLTTVENFERMKRNGQLPNDASPLYAFTAETGEVASTIHHERQGWEAYKPIGEPALCPNQCGSFYYPDGSGECPVCGQIC